MLTVRRVEAERLVAPAEHLGVLIEPAPAELLRAIREFDSASIERTCILNTTAGGLRRNLRRRLGLTGPVICTGHQSEFVHAGVFAKNIAAAELARAAGAEAMYVAVDADLPKSTRLIVPQVTADGLRRAATGIPGCDPRLGTEFHAPVDASRWREFFSEVRAACGGANESLLSEFERTFLDTPERGVDFCDALERGRAACESELGTPPLTGARVSALAQTPEFRAFVLHLIANAAHCAETYNAAQEEYRRRHRVRTIGRPVPPLAIRDDRIEAPLWVVRAGQPRRRLYSATRGSRFELFADGERIGSVERAALARPADDSALAELGRSGWLLRPRALTLAAFARLLLADLFIHGIGGAKYDEITEEWIRVFLGVELAPMACVTATLQLPLPRRGVLPAALARARWEQRDVMCNPQRYLRHAAQELVRERERLIRRSDELRRDRSKERAARRAAYLAIRGLNESILARDPELIDVMNARVAAMERALELDRIALDREYFFALHPRDELQALQEQIQRRIAAR